MSMEQRMRWITCSITWIIVLLLSSRILSPGSSHRNHFCKGSTPNSVRTKLFYIHEQSLPLSTEAYSNDHYSSLDNSIGRTTLFPPVPQGFLVAVGVGVTWTNGSVSSDSGAMVATCGTVSVTGVVPPFLATLFATSAAAQTSFLTWSPMSPIALAALGSIISQSFFTLPCTAPIACTVQISLETKEVRLRISGKNVRVGGLEPAQMICFTRVTL